MEDQRRTGGGRQIGDGAGQDHVVSGRDHVLEVARDPEEGVVDRRQAVALAGTLTEGRSAACTASSVRDPRSRQASISIGSIESDETAFAVAPAGPSAPFVATVVTPVGRLDIADRK